jgi:hypothetical protein
MQLIDRAPGTASNLVRRLQTTAGVGFVFAAGRWAPAAVHFVAESLARAAPEALIAYSGIPSERHRQTLRDHPAVDVCMGREAEAVVGELFGLCAGLQPSRAVPQLTPRGCEPVAQAAISADDLRTIASPYLTGMLPAAAAPRVGVETDRSDFPGRKADGSPVRSHTVERVIAELRWIDQRSGGNSTIPFIGELFCSRPQEARGLCAAVAHARLRQSTLQAAINVGTATSELLDDLEAAGVRELVLRADTTTPLSPATLAERMEATLVAVESRGMRVRVHLWLGDSVQRAEDLVDEVAMVAPGFTHSWWDPPEKCPRPSRRPHAPGLNVSRTLRQREQSQRLLVKRLLRMEEGLYPDAPVYADAVIDLLWAHPSPPREHTAWLSQLLSFDSVLFCLRRSATEDTADACFPLSHCALVEERADSWVIDGVRSLRLVGYATARDTSPPGPLLLTMDSPADVRAFLEDADEAHATGTFRAGFCHPLTWVRDLVCWVGPGRDPSTRLARLVVDETGALRPAHDAHPIGRVGEVFDVLCGRARARLAALQDRMDTTSEGHVRCWPCLSIPEWMSQPQLWEHQRQRPWLDRYVAVPAAVRRLARLHPDLVTTQGLGALRVSTFGGRRYYDGPDADPGRSPALLVDVGAQSYLYHMRSDRVVRVSHDLAAIFEAVEATSGDVGVVSEWLAHRHAVTQEQAKGGLAAAVLRLHRMGML